MSCLPLLFALDRIRLTHAITALVVPGGRLYPIRQDLLDAIKPETEGGNGHAKNFWEWSEEQVRGYS